MSYAPAVWWQVIGCLTVKLWNYGWCFVPCVDLYALSRVVFCKKAIRRQKIQVFYNIALCLWGSRLVPNIAFISKTLELKAVRPFETSGINNSSICHMPECLNLLQHCLKTSDIAQFQGSSSTFLGNCLIEYSSFSKMPMWTSDEENCYCVCLHVYVLRHIHVFTFVASTQARPVARNYGTRPF